MPQVEHIGIAVSNVDDALRIFRDVLGETPYKVEAIEKDGIRTHFIRGGGVKLELLEAAGPDSAISRYLEKRGGGLHHLAFEVDDVESALARLVLLGYAPIDREARPGADGKVIAFLHPKETAGILIELCESRRSVLTGRDLFLEGQAAEVNSDRPALLIFGDVAQVEPYGARMEQTCRLVLAADHFERSYPREVHVLAVGSYVEAALNAAAGHPSRVRSLSLVGAEKAMPEMQKPSCPVLVVSEDAEPALEVARDLRRLIGGALAVYPTDQPELGVAAVEGFVRANLTRSSRP